MKIVGVTGGIGSGKTTVCEVFSELGIPIYSADSRAKVLMNADGFLKDDIINAFGSESYMDGVLNRTYLAEQVFNSPKKLAVLNGLVHPAVANDFELWAENQRDVPYIIKEAAILFESGAYEDVDITLLVIAPEETRLQRVMKRDSVSREAVQARMANQWTQERKQKLADHIIINDGNQLIIPQILELHRRFSK